MRTLLHSGWALPLLLLACGGGGDDATTSAPQAGAAGTAGAVAGTAGVGAASGGKGGSVQSGGGQTAGAGGGAAAGAAGTGGNAASAGGNAASAGGNAAGMGGNAGGAAGAGNGGGPSAGMGGSSTAGAGGSPNATGLFANPQVPHTFTYRIAEAYTPTETSSYDVVGLDLFDNDKATITALKQKGKTVICYFSSTYEDWRPDFTALSSAADKSALADLQAGPLDSWPGEQWVDLHGFSPTSPSAAHTLLRKIMLGRIQQASAKGCDAVDFDNVNEQENMVKNKSGQSITALDQLAFNTWLADQAHAASMKAFLKNDLSQIADDAAYPQGKGLAKIFDGAINEQCFEFDECDLMTPFRDLQKPVFVIQYKYGSSFPTATHTNLANTLHLNVSYYAKGSTTALQGDPSQTFGAW